MKSYAASLLALSLIFSAGHASCQTPSGQDHHHAEVNSRGNHVMGFSQDTTAHHFALTYDGGLIDVRANDVKDTASRDEIRTHFRHIAEKFAGGDFDAPMLIHGPNVPGVAAMSQLKDQLHWEIEETARGARIVITADSKPARDALHAFLKFQIEDHQTGDCTVVH
jgi:hypothetical protein